MCPTQISKLPLAAAPQTHVANDSRPHGIVARCCSPGPPARVSRSQNDHVRCARKRGTCQSPVLTWRSLSTTRGCRTGRYADYKGMHSASSIVFVVSSTMERSLYADYFGIDPQRIEMHSLGRQLPGACRRRSLLVPGDYICAVGSQGQRLRCAGRGHEKSAARKTLSSWPQRKQCGELSAFLPTSRCVPTFRCVRRPTSSDIASVWCCRFLGSMCLVAHVTQSPPCICPRRLLRPPPAESRTTFMTASTDVSPQPRITPGLAALIAELVESPDDCRRPAEAGQRFAQRHCSEDNAVAFFLRVLPTLDSGSPLSSSRGDAFPFHWIWPLRL